MAGTRQSCAGAAALAVASGAAAFAASPSVLRTSIAASPRAPPASAAAAAAPAPAAGANLAAIAAPAALALAAAASPAARRQRRARLVVKAETSEVAEDSVATDAKPKDLPLDDLPPSLRAAAERAAAGTNIRGAGERSKASGARAFDVTAQAGVTDPFGYFDPLSLCPLNDEAAFRKLRVSEMKHGRIAMLASVGLVAQHYIRFPGGAFEEVPSGVFAVANPTGGFGLSVVVWVCLVLEFVILAQDPAKEVGDFGDPFGVGMNSREMRDRELNNGRAAMFATIGIIVAELATGKDGMEQLGLP